MAEAILLSRANLHFFCSVLSIIWKEMISLDINLEYRDCWISTWSSILYWFLTSDNINYIGEDRKDFRIFLKEIILEIFEHLDSAVPLWPTLEKINWIAFIYYLT